MGYVGDYYRGYEGGILGVWTIAACGRLEAFILEGHVRHSVGQYCRFLANAAVFCP